MKIRRLSDGALFALAGDDHLEERIIEWLEDATGDLPPQGKDFTAILVESDGTLKTYTGSGDRFYKWFEGYAAFGSGQDFAYGAMEAGASAEEAVRAAARRNPTTGGVIQVERPGYVEPNED